MPACNIILALTLTAPLLAACIVLSILCLALLIRVSKDRAKLLQRGLLFRWPIPSVDPGHISPALRTTELGPSLDSLVSITPSLGVRGGISDLESCILAALAKAASARALPGTQTHIFEFGTCTGKTTHHLALNAGHLARVVTLTLAPDQHTTYQRGNGDDPRDTHAALKESAFTRFYYSGTNVEPQITQLFGDSKVLDITPHQALYDLIFVDGSHARSYVESDSRLAMHMLKPGGLILWHDYRGPWRARGVWSTLNALAQSHTLVHIKGTSLVVYTN